MPLTTVQIYTPKNKMQPPIANYFQQAYIPAMHPYNEKLRKERQERQRRYKRMIAKKMSIRQIADLEGVTRQAIEKVLK